MTRWPWLGLWMACQPEPIGGGCGADVQPGRFRIHTSGTDALEDAVLVLGAAEAEITYTSPDGEVVVVLRAPE